MTAPHSPEAAACVAAVAVSGHLTKASDEEVRAIRAAYAAGGETHLSLAKKFDRPEGTVRQWVAGLTRRNAGGPITRPGIHHANRRLSDDYEVNEAGCWVWTGSLNHEGYGRTTVDRTFWFAHRLSWTITNGPIPDDMTVDHVCFNPPCVNPNHLQLLSRSDNSRRQRLRIANVCKRGHQFDAENTRVDSKGKRSCRACTRDRQNAANARLREAS